MTLLFDSPAGKFWHGNTLNHYEEWPAPTVIISDGPYGISGYQGDARTPDQLVDLYEPHVAAWSKKAKPETTLWFWNTEVGWATVHPLLLRHGWLYRGCNIWDKGLNHIAGNCNGKTMRKFPVVTEVCAHYVRREVFQKEGGDELHLQEWLRREWQRTGLPFSEANLACGVKNAASRKYLAADHLWYFPPADVFAQLVGYANEKGAPEGRPYFTLDGRASLTPAQWERQRAKFHFEYGVTNVWHAPAIRGKERLKSGLAVSHPNQKPQSLMRRIIEASSDIGDLVWEPFGGVGSGCLQAQALGRPFRGCELLLPYALQSVGRLQAKPRVTIPGGAPE